MSNVLLHVAFSLRCPGGVENSSCRGKAIGPAAEILSFAPLKLGSDWIRTELRTSYFDAFSSREPVPTSLENALMTIQPSFPAPSDAAPAEAAARVTPMMEQYLEIKAANPGLLLFYRMGDFYELFFEDAEIASRALGIMLTKRGKHQGMDIPMCGVPVERSDDYLHRLIAQGHRVAVCEQMEDPAAARARGNKSVVRRDVVRLVTPGTLTEDTLLDARANNYLLAIVRARGSAGSDRIGLAWIDISTSDFIVTTSATGELAATLSRINPNEVIVT